MARKTYKPEQIVIILRQIEVQVAKGLDVMKACRNVGIVEQTYYRWRKEYGGMKLDQAKRLKDLEKENSQLKKLVADLSFDNSILKEAVQGNF